MKTLFLNGKIHTMVSENDIMTYLLVEDGIITKMGNNDTFDEVKTIALKDVSVNLVNLDSKHVYPCIVNGEYGVLEVGKAADFFTLNDDIKDMKPQKVDGFEPVKTYKSGKEEQ